MTAKLEQVLSDIDTLSKAELKVVQEHVSEKLEENKPFSNKKLNDEKPTPHLRIGYRLSPKVIEPILAEFLTPEELAEVGGNTGNGEFPTLPKTITEYIDEDREDRV